MRGHVVVTGAAGFIGSHVCRHLLANRCTVTGIDNFDPYYDRTIKERRLVPLLDSGGFSLVEADIREVEMLRRMLRGADAVVHLAARPGVRQSFEKPRLYFDVNVGGTVALLEVAASVGVKRIVFSSSSSVYGEVAELPLRESFTDLRPISPYAVSKRAAELMCYVLAGRLGVAVAALRLFTVYGPGQRPDQAVARFTADLMAGRAIRLFGDGNAKRDCTFVDDVTDGIVKALAWTQRQGPGCEIVNLGSGTSVTVSRLIDLVAQAIGTVPEVSREPAAAGDVQHTLADLGKARTLLGYEPRVSIEEGIPAFVDWFRGYHGTKSRTTG